MIEIFKEHKPILPEERKLLEPYFVEQYNDATTTTWVTLNMTKEDGDDLVDELNEIEDEWWLAYDNEEEAPVVREIKINLK